MPPNKSDRKQIINKPIFNYAGCYIGDYMTSVYKHTDIRDQMSTTGTNVHL